jgi:hypothetical protein
VPVTIPTILAATWRDGLFAFTGEASRHELAGQSVGALARDGHDGALAIVDGHSLCRRAPGGEWSTLGTSEFQLACAVAVGDVIYVGTDDARVLCIGATGKVAQLRGFDAVPGRDKWYAGSAVINGQVVGPPLGIRSITATSDGSVLLVNVHVGGIPRSTDGGATWRPTIAVDSDVHEVRAHETHPGLVIAAAGVGLCVSRDSGATWTVEKQGLHAPYCSAVAFSANDILVSASADHFAPRGALYRRPIDLPGLLEPVGVGLPRWVDGIVDTGCIAARASALAVADKGGNLFVSADAGRSWSRRAQGLSAPSSLLIL